MNFFEIIAQTFAQSGFVAMTWQQGVMILVSFVLLYMAIKKGFEPLLLLPIAFGMLLANLPLAGLMYDATAEGLAWYNSGVLRIIYMGVKSSIFPCLIFMGVGAMTDFGPLIANPISLLLGAAAQFGIYVAFTLANYISIFLGECVNFPLQRSVTFKSHGPLVPQILCHLKADKSAACHHSPLNLSSLHSLSEGNGIVRRPHKEYIFQIKTLNLGPEG